jgi:S1-C subfamily serine protease
MNREARQHIIYGSILVIIVLGIVSSSYLLNLRTRDALLQEIFQLRQQVTDLQQKDVELAEQFNVRLSEKDIEIKSLSGELDVLRDESERQISDIEDKVSVLKSEFQDFSDVIEESLPSVVSVRTNVGRGSGFIVDSRGYIVTNYHVVEGAQAGNVVTSDGRTYSVRLVGFDDDVDIAVLRINATGLDTLQFGDSETVKVGEKAIAIGSPGGFDFTVTQGIVSAINREDSQGNQYVQIDTPINPGNSGGPLIDASGRVIGVATLKISGFESVGFALESSYVEPIVEDIIDSDR